MRSTRKFYVFAQQTNNNNNEMHRLMKHHAHIMLSGHVNGNPTNETEEG